MYPYGSVGLPDFRRMVAEAASTAHEHIIVSYSRKEFLQTGDGHFSPIGGFRCVFGPGRLSGLGT